MRAPPSLPAPIFWVSARWIQEGRKFKTDLNGWLAQIYAGEKSSEEEPQDTRSDMADEVLNLARQLSSEGRSDELRKLFPPAHEPFDHENINPTGVDQVMLLKDGRVVTSIARQTYLLDGNKITEVEGVVADARSAYGEVYGKAYPDRLDIHQSWDGPVLRSLPWPKDYGELVPIGGATFDSLLDFGRLTTLSLFPDGKRAVLATQSGVFLVDESFGCLLHPNAETIAEGIAEEEDDEEAFSLWLDYPSPDRTLSPLACKSLLTSCSAKSMESGSQQP